MCSSSCRRCGWPLTASSVECPRQSWAAQPSTCCPTRHRLSSGHWAQKRRPSPSQDNGYWQSHRLEWLPKWWALWGHAPCWWWSHPKQSLCHPAKSLQCAVCPGPSPCKAPAQASQNAVEENPEKTLLAWPFNTRRCLTLNWLSGSSRSAATWMGMSFSFCRSTSSFWRNSSASRAKTSIWSGPALLLAAARAPASSTISKWGIQWEFPVPHIPSYVGGWMCWQWHPIIGIAWGENQCCPLFPLSLQIKFALNLSSLLSRVENTTKTNSKSINLDREIDAKIGRTNRHKSSTDHTEEDLKRWQRYKRSWSRINSNTPLHRRIARLSEGHESILPLRGFLASPSIQNMQFGRGWARRGQASYIPGG